MPSLRNVSAIHTGNRPVTKAYLGSQQIWPSSPTSTIAQQNSDIWDGPSVTFELPSTSSATSTLVLIIAGNGSVAAPTGWTLRKSEVNWMGHYLYTRTGGTATSWTVTTAATGGTWWIAEVTNSNYDSSVSSNQTFGNNSFTTPPLTPTAGQRILIASIGSINDTGRERTISSWTNGFSGVADLSNSTAEDYPMQGVATQEVLADGTTEYSTTATFSDTSIGRSGILCSLVTATSGAEPVEPVDPEDPGGNDDTTPPTAPTNLVATPSPNSVSVTWTASSDDVGVIGYEYSLDGTNYVSIGSTFTTYTISGLTESTAYTIRVRAFDAAGNRSSPSAVNTSTTTIVGGGDEGILGLPGEPWHGGSVYYDQFPAAASQGWNSPTFFPFASFPNSFDSAEQVAWDSQTINTYHAANPWSTWSHMPANNMSWIGGQLDSLYDGVMPTNFAPWVAFGIEDEIDGTSELPQDALSRIADQMADFPTDTGRFVFANYTQRVMQSAWAKPGGGYWGEDFVNYPGIDVICIDMYWYTVPDASFYNGYVPGGDTVKGPGARTAGSYGASIRALRWLDAQDGHHKPIWMYIENLSGSPGENFVRYIEPHELKAAVMSCITNGATGIVWFNNVASSTHYVANVSRVAQMNPGHAAATRVQAAKEIKEFVESLAPVINTQSYIWSFGASTIDTMLKEHEGYAYIFAVPGTGGGSGPILGSKTFQLPPGVTGNIEVIGESRSITPTGSTFTDTFPDEHTWHVYKIAIS